MIWSFDTSKPVREWLPTILYPGFRPGMPDVMLGRLPQDVFDLTGQRFTSWIIENPKEARLLEARLGEPIPLIDGEILDFASGPDTAVRKKGVGMSFSDIVIAVYSPPQEGWPYLVLVSFPIHHDEIERGRYTWETFDTSQEAVDYGAALTNVTGAKVDFRGPDSLIKS